MQYSYKTTNDAAADEDTQKGRKICSFCDFFFARVLKWSIDIIFNG